jgi:FkbM family methyltransferase
MKLKHIFKILLSGIYVKIKSGPLKGKKWIVTSGGKFIQGDQEKYKTDAFMKNFAAGDVFFDIGAHFGYYSAIAAMINNGSGQVFAFEPRPMNAGFFRKHMKINDFKNVTLIEAAVGETDKDVHFDTGHGSATGHVSNNGDISVKQVSIDRMVKDSFLPVPGFIKIDVEGGEIEVLRGSKEVISKYKPKMIIATHTPECYQFVIEFLDRNKYRYEVLNPDSVKGDTEIVALPQ